MGTILILILTLAFTTPSDSWQIVYEDQKGNNHEATVSAVTAADALFLFEKEHGDQFVTCMARKDKNICRRSIGQ